MWTGLVYAVLMTLCLSSFVIAAGTHFRETTTSPKSALTTKKNLVTTTTATKATTTEQPAPTQPPEINPHPALVGRRANCSCTYINSDYRLAAFSGSEKLKNGTLIKDGCKVRFHCTSVGYFRLRGPTEITCKDCKTWHSSEYPECDPPQQGDTILRFEGPYTLLPGGEIGVFPGARLKVLCIPNGSSEYPQWVQFQKTNNVRFTDEVLTEGGASSPIQVLQITDIGPEERGWYKCSPRIGRPSSFALNILEPQTAACLKFNHPDYIVQYNDGQNVNSMASFSCKDPKLEVSGPNVFTCLSNGRWSGYPAQCLKLCPAIQSSESLVITYNDNRKLFSSAAFNCISPSVIDGASFTRCKYNGEWEDPVPVCKIETLMTEATEMLSSTNSLSSTVHSTDSNLPSSVPTPIPVTTDETPNNNFEETPHNHETEHDTPRIIHEVPYEQNTTTSTNQFKKSSVITDSANPEKATLTETNSDISKNLDDMTKSTFTTDSANPEKATPTEINSEISKNLDDIATDDFELIASKSPEEIRYPKISETVTKICGNYDLNCMKFNCPSPYGSHLHPNNRKMYIVCINWRPRVRACGPGMALSVKRMKCVKNEQWWSSWGGYVP